MSSASTKAVQGNQESSKSHLQSASRRHREKLNSALEELGSLLPLPDDVKAKLDKLSVLKLSVSFFQTKKFVTKDQKQKLNDCILARHVRKNLVNEKIGLSDISLEALDSMFIVFTESGDVFYVSENVKSFFGYSQTYLIHQDFEKFVHPEDITGFQRCLQKPEQKIVELCREFDDDCASDTDKMASRRVCFCSIRCHAGRQSSHVSPFYYRSFKFDGHVRPLGSINGNGNQYGYFALCTPVNPASVSTSTPRELVQYYGCKMGLDLKLHKLDNRGTKIFKFTESEYMDISGYFFVNLEDISAMKLTHEQLMECGQSTGVFRLMTASGDYQWIKGRARVVYDKNGKPEFIHADNIILGKEDGPFYKSVQWEILSKWSADRTARKQHLALPSHQEGNNTNALASPSSTCSGAIVVSNAPSQEDQVTGSSSGIKAEPLRTKPQAKETVHRCRSAAPCSSSESMPETMATSTPTEYSASEDPVAELEHALGGDINGSLPLGSQSMEEEVTLLKSLLVESNNNDLALPQMGFTSEGAMANHTGASSCVWTGSSSVSSRRAAQEFSEQLQILKSYLIDEQFGPPTSFKSPSFQPNRPHPYSNHRKNGTKMSGDQAGGSWLGNSGAVGASYGSLTANISSMQSQAFPPSQAPPLSNGPSVPFLSAPSSSCGMPSWDAPVSQGGVGGANMHLTPLDSPPEAGENPPVLLPATTSYTAGSAMDLGTVTSRPFPTDAYFSCGVDSTAGIMATVPSSHLDDAVEEKRAQLIANGYDSLISQNSVDYRSSGRLHHEVRAAQSNWNLETFDTGRDLFYRESGVSPFSSSNSHRVRGSLVSSNGQQGITLMQHMNGVVEESGKGGDAYRCTTAKGYSASSCSYPKFPTRGNYHEQQSQPFGSAAVPTSLHQNGFHRAPGQQRLNHSPPCEAVPNNQSPTRQLYQSGLPMTNGYVQSAQNMGHYQHTAQSWFTKGDTSWTKTPKKTSQESASIHEPLGMYGAPFSKASHG